MKRKRRPTLLHTTIAVFLSINVQVERGGQAWLYSLPLLPLTTWLAAWWYLRSTVRRLNRTIRATLADISDSLAIWLAVTNVGIKSVLFGIGVAL